MHMKPYFSFIYIYKNIYALYVTGTIKKYFK